MGHAILYADDSRTSRVMVERFLTKLGYLIVSVEDGGKAVALASEQSFHALILDIHMPVMSGIEATRQVRLLPQPYCDVSIVGLSAGSVAEMQAARDSGMDVVLPKPIDFEALASTIVHLEPRPALPPPPAPLQSINIETLARLVDDIGVSAVRVRLRAFLEEAPRQVGLISLAAARENLESFAAAMASLCADAALFGAERLADRARSGRQPAHLADWARMPWEVSREAAIVIAVLEELDLDRLDRRRALRQ